MSDKERQDLIAFAKELSHPDWCLSVPQPAKVVIRNLLAALEATKPRTITTAEELDTLPQWSAILDGQGDVAQKLNGRWHFPETAAEGASKVIKYGPVTLIHEPAQ